MIAISSFNLLLLFCAIELQNIPSYAIAGFDIKNPKCATASIKYFILNNIMTCFGLFGISFIYGFAGSLDFKEIADVCKSNINIGLTFGFILFLTNILFKLSAAPLHFWTPDIYEDIPIYSLNYFSSTLKISNILILVNLITEILWEYTAISINMLKYIAILSMLVGAFGGLYQTSLKKILAFSTILNIGYILMGISIHTNAAINASLNYAIIYSISLVAFIICLILLKLPQNFDDLKSISKISICLTLIIFSIIGLPPFLGFFVKYNLFYQVINEREFLLITVSIISTIISSIYYLRIISNLFFKKDNNIILQKNNAPILSILLIIFIIILSFGALYIRF
jgi:NADH-quinone oxidoreductase subunit N